mgnify:CR=1 FL=1
MLNSLLILALVLIIGHQIDAAWWEEWEMFRLPGGIQLNVLMNLLIFWPLLWIFMVVVQRRPGAWRWALALAGACALILPIHAGFALAGFGQFHLPVSMAVIALSFLTAIALAVVSLRSRHEFG